MYNSSGFHDLHFLVENCPWSPSGMNRKINNNTLSLFTNIQGKSSCKVENHRVQISENNFFLSNQNQGYTLEIEDKKTEKKKNADIAEIIMAAL